jgi:PAS domain S-box-containing protein
MEDEKKTKKQLIEELKELRQSAAELKGFEEEIKQTRVNQEKFTKAFLQNSIPVGITTLKEGRFIDVSNTFLSLMGRKRDEVVGHTSLEIGFITEEQRSIFFDELNKVGRIENLEMKVRTEGGALRDGLFNAVMLSLNNEKHLLTVMTDITDRKRAEEALRGSEVKYRGFYESTHDGIAMTDIKGNIVECNRAYADMLGYTQKGIRGLTYQQTTPAKWHDMERDIVINKILKTGYSDIYEKEYIKKDGTVFPISIRIWAIKDEAGAITGMWGIIRDITDQKQADEALTASEHKYRTLTEQMPDFIWHKDIKSVYVSCNRRYAEAVGLNVENIAGRRDEDFYPPELAAKYATDDQTVIATCQPLETDELWQKDGEKRWVHTSKAPLLDASGRCIGTIGIGRDITDRKRAEDELAKYREGLEQLVAERTQGLEDKTKALEELNISLKVLLRHREEDKKELEDRFVMNIKKLIMPFAEKIKRTRLDEEQLAYMSIIEKHLNDITSSLTKRMHQFNFTPREVEVASLLNEGKTTKEIAKIIGVATSSINSHRNQIRKKLGISKKRVNLRSHLQSFD